MGRVFGCWGLPMGIGCCRFRLSICNRLLCVIRCFGMVVFRSSEVCVPRHDRIFFDCDMRKIIYYILYCQQMKNG